MNITIKQSENAKQIISGYETQLEGKGYYGYGKHDKFVSNYYEEAKKFAGLSASDVELFLAEYGKCKVTGNENPVFFAKACEKTTSALIELNAKGIPAPTEVSIGLVERHELISLAFTKLEPPLILYTSSLFDFVGDISFFYLCPLMRSLFGLNQYSLDSEDRRLLVDLLSYHSLSSYHNISDTGKILFAFNRHLDPPQLSRRMPGGVYAELFFKQLFEYKDALYEYIALHESAHIRNKDVDNNNNKKGEELICDELAIVIYISNRIKVSVNNGEQPLLTCAKLILPLLFIEFISYIEICKIAEKEQRPLESISHDSGTGDYPTFNDRITAAENVTFETLSRFSVGSNLTYPSHSLWSVVKKSIYVGWQNIIPELNTRLSYSSSGINIEKLRTHLLRRDGNIE